MRKADTMLTQIKSRQIIAHEYEAQGVYSGDGAPQRHHDPVTTGFLGKLCLLAALCQITACDAFSSDSRTEAEIVVKPQVIRATDANSLSTSAAGATAASRTGAESMEGQQSRVAVTGSDAIPYPIYPDAKQYRVGGENGLHVVIFETSDTFEEVDSFYQNYVGSQGYARLVGMADYVRYDTSREAAAGNTSDAWRNDRPGIVIHGFESSDEAISSGADAAAKTNIIVSY